MYVCRKHYRALSQFSNLTKQTFVNCFLRREISLQTMICSSESSNVMLKKQILNDKTMKTMHKKFVQRDKSDALPPSDVSLQVIQNGSTGNGKCVFLTTSNNRYLFNCPENASRIMRLIPQFHFHRLQDVFITQRTWRNAGGLPGVCLSLKHAGVGALNIHGPSGIQAIFTATNCVYDGAPPVAFVSRPYDEGDFEDQSMIVTYVPLSGRPQSRIVSFQEKNDKDLSVDAAEDLSVGFICRLKQRPGKMNVDACFKYNIPDGPLFGKLQRGQSITLAGGKVINPEDVLLPPDPATSFALVDVADSQMLDSLLKCSQFDPYFDTGNTAPNDPPKLDLLVHFTEPDIMDTREYKDWMEKFGSNTQHLVVNSAAPFCPHNKGIYVHQAKLNRLDDSVYPLLRCHTTYKVTHALSDLDAKIVPAEPYLTYYLRPHKKFFRHSAFIVDKEPNSHVREMFDMEPLLKDVLTDYEARFRQSSTEHAVAPESQSELVNGDSTSYPEVVFLGTASAVQTKYRGNSAILVNFNRYHSVLLDCGEGTYNQMFEFYQDDQQLDEALSRIKLIFISHMHADHHMGVLTLLLQRRRAFERLGLNFEPVFLLAPSELFKIHFLYSQLVEDVMPLAKRVTTTGDGKMVNIRLAEVRHRMRFRSMSVCKVSHPKSSYGLVLTTANGYKMVYSGDTMPSTRLVAQGADCDLLIHEATFDDTRLADAKFKMHCTVGQALNVAYSMRAKYTILTHISGRYYMPVLAKDVSDLGHSDGKPCIISTDISNSDLDEALFNRKPIIRANHNDQKAMQQASDDNQISPLMMPSVDLPYDTFCFASDFMRYTPALSRQLTHLRPVLLAAFRRHFEHSVRQVQNYDMRLTRERRQKLQQIKADEMRLKAAA